ncbi:DUF99 family protein [Nanoarchaeota archaeon]
MKKEIRVIGIDDSPFDKFDPVQRDVLVVGTVYRGGDFMDGLVSTSVEIDGEDATVNLIEMINNCKFKPQVQAIFLDGVSLAGFNIVNTKALSEKTGLPVIVVVREYPDFESIFQALEKLGMQKKIELIKQMPKPVKVNDIYAQFIGIDEEKGKELLKICSPRSFVPECIRVAHIIASGVVDGESRGRA